MTTIVSFNPNRAADLSGFAVPGALATFYDSGTSRERIVYSDPECTLPHPSPLAADGAGVFPAIYDTGDGDVKVEVTTPEGVMLAGYPMDRCGWWIPMQPALRPSNSIRPRTFPRRTCRRRLSGCKRT